MSKNNELKVCEDCKDYITQGELPPDTSVDRDSEITLGLIVLTREGAQVLPDFGETEDNLQECTCGHIFPIADSFLGKDEDGADNFACPECQSLEIKDRDNGEDEFSNAPCDCCGTDLAGKRFRFLQLYLNSSEEENHEQTDQSNPSPEGRQGD